MYTVSGESPCVCPPPVSFALSVCVCLSLAVSVFPNQRLPIASISYALKLKLRGTVRFKIKHEGTAADVHRFNAWVELLPIRNLMDQQLVGGLGWHPEGTLCKV